MKKRGEKMVTHTFAYTALHSGEEVAQCTHFVSSGEDAKGGGGISVKRI